jgi:CrcB protein
MKACVLVGLGGIAGALARHYLAGWISAWAGRSFPWGIFGVNMAGCFLMGLVMALAEHTRWIPAETRWFVATGFLGSLTTFSTLSGDTFLLLRQGQMALAMFNAGGSVLGGLGAVCGGYYLTLWLRS